VVSVCGGGCVEVFVVSVFVVSVFVVSVGGGCVEVSVVSVGGGCVVTVSVAGSVGTVAVGGTTRRGTRRGDACVVEEIIGCAGCTSMTLG